MKVDPFSCTGCGYCILVCPYDALASDGQIQLLSDRCTDCNLCLYTCHADCFRPDVPPRPYRPRLSGRYDVVVIGSGIGGLMAAAALAKAGRSVAVFEKLGFPGGRYTELTYRGAAVTTGAWTNLGPNSHIGRFLVDLGIDLPYISLSDAGLPEQYAVRFPDGRHFSRLVDLLSAQTHRAWLKALSDGRKQLRQSPGSNLHAVSAADYIARYTADPDLLAVVDALAATASGVSARQMPASEFLQITLDSRDAGLNFAMPVGGVKAIIQALVSTLRRHGGRLFVRTPVNRILVEQQTATGIQLHNGQTVQSEIILHNAGPARLVRLAGTEQFPSEYLDRLQRLKGVECAALIAATRRPLFTGAPILITPNSKRVVGIFAPTLLDPGLAPSGLHLFDAFFPLHSPDRRGELSLALADLRALFPDFEHNLLWTVPMFFTGNWPGTETGQFIGQTGNRRLPPETPIRNCYLVGMDVQGSGVAGDLIPLGVRQVLQQVGVPAWLS